MLNIKIISAIVVSKKLDFINRINRFCHYTAQHWLKCGQRQRLRLRIKRRGIVLCAELGCIFKMRMIAELLAHVAIHAEMVEKIIALENTVMLHHP